LPDVHQSVGASIEWKVSRNRCFFELSFVATKMGEALEVPVVGAGAFAGALRQVIHLPALRGNPARVYPVAKSCRDFLQAARSVPAGAAACPGPLWP
jgi:hypothetical protein